MKPPPTIVSGYRDCKLDSKAILLPWFWARMEGTADPRNSTSGRILLRNIAERVSDKHTLPKRE
jgi:hypothetical protein